MLPLMAATFILCTCVGAEARSSQRPSQTKPTVAKPKPKVSQPEQPKWKVFTPPDGRFSVLMPGQPKMETQVQKTYMGEIQLQIFVAQPPNQEVAYLVTYNDFPDSYGQITSPEEILKDAQEIALKTTQSNLVRQQNIRSSNGHPGKEIEYVNPGGKITKNRMYVAEGRLYQVMVIITKKQRKTLDKTMTGYLNSFHVVLKK